MFGRGGSLTRQSEGANLSDDLRRDRIQMSQCQVTVASDGGIPEADVDGSGKDCQHRLAGVGVVTLGQNKGYGAT